MWPKAYKDYPKDTPLKKERITSGKGIVGCEMHELLGWGETQHIEKKKKKGYLSRLFKSLFGKKD